MNNALFLDVDGVLNQYDNAQRKQLYRKYVRSKFDPKFDVFNPYSKKVFRLSKLIKKYNFDVFLFSAWTIRDLQPFVPFEILSDTRKSSESVIEIMAEYDNALLIDDELSSGLFGYERSQIPSNLITYQPNYKYGLVLRDFKKLEYVLNLNGFKN